ncbi:fluoride efflux transporter FluC [Corynebacterium qintianiae]|nr:CrcB family protein [Corynebacterium qintianiae]
MIAAFLSVALGGFLGGIARWALSRSPGGTAGTWAANAVGSAVLGFTVGMPGIWPLLLGTGFAGALSTWSTLSRELGLMIKQRRWREVARYALATVVAGLIGALFGLRYAARAFGS